MKFRFTELIERLVSTPMDETVDIHRLYSFLSAKSVELERQLQLRRIDPSDELLSDLRRVGQLMPGKAIPYNWTPLLSKTREETESTEDARGWLGRSRAGKVFSSGVLVVGAGQHLDRLEQHGTQRERAWARENIEVLLRQVEVRRKRWLLRTRPESKADGLWLEWHDVAVLFSRFARRNGDLRILNASFKLNDWAFPIHQGKVAPYRLARYLLALAEQEAAAGELLR